MKLDEAEETIKKLAVKVKELEKSLKVESRDRERLSEMCIEYEAKLGTCDKNVADENVAENGEVKSLTAKVTELEDSLKTEVAERDRLRNVCEQFAADLDQNEVEIEALKSEIETLKTEIERKDSIERQSQEKGLKATEAGTSGSPFDEERTLLQERVAELEQFLDVSRKESDQLQGVCEEIEEKLKGSEELTEQLKREMELKDTENKTLMAKVDELTSSLETMREETGRSKDEGQEFAADLQKYEEEIKQLREEIAQKNTELEKKEAWSQKQHNVIMKRNEDSIEQKNEIKKLTALTQKQESDIWKLQAKVDELTSSLETMKEETGRSKDEGQEFAADLQKYEEEIKQLREEIAQKNTELEKKEAWSQKQHNVIMKRNEDSTEQKNEIKKLTAQTQKQESEIWKLQATVDELTLSLETMREETGRSKDEGQEFAADIQKYEEEIKKLREEIAQKNTELEKKEAWSQKQHNVIMKRNEDSIEQKNEIKKLTAQTQKQESEIWKLQAQLQEQTEACANKGDSDELHGKVDELEKERERIQGVCDELSVDIDNYKTEIKLLKEENQQKITEIQKQNSEIQKLKTEIQKLKTKIQTQDAEVQKLRVSQKPVKGTPIKGTPMKGQSANAVKLQGRISELENLLEAEKSERIRLNGVCEEYEAELDIQVAQIKKMKTEIEAKEIEIQKLKASGNGDVGATLGAEVSESCQDALEKECVALKAKVKKGSRILEEKEKEVQDWKMRYYSLSEDREEIFDLLQVKKGEILRLQAVIEENRMISAELTEEELKQGLHTTYICLKNRCEGLELQLKEEIEKYEEKKKVYRKTIRDLSEKVTDLEKQLGVAPPPKDNWRLDAAYASPYGDPFEDFLELLENPDYKGPLKFTPPKANDEVGGNSLEAENIQMKVMLTKCYQVIRQKVKKLQEQMIMYVDVLGHKDELYDTLQEKKKEVKKLQQIIEDNRMIYAELTPEEQEKGLKKTFEKLKEMCQDLEEKVEQQQQEYEEKRVNYRKIIGDLRIANRELKEGGATSRPPLAAKENLQEEDDEDDQPSNCKQS